MELELHDLLLARFSENGEGPKEYNCWNLCREIYRRCGKALPKYSDYIAVISQRDNLIKTVIEDDFLRIDKSEPLCLVTLMLAPRAITHIGVVLDNRRFIHVRRNVGVVVERLDNKAWKKRIEGFYRYAGNN